jgi:RimJ/RimL family protein N-acetyltransferase
VARHYSFFRGDDARAVSLWVGQHIPGGERGFGPCVASAVFDGKRIIGGTVYHNYDPDSGVIEMTGAGKDWWSREYLHAVFDYIFNVAGCQMAVMRIAENNARMLRIAEKFGFEKHFIPRLRGRDTGEYIATFTDDDWRSSRFYMRQEHGQTVSSNAA